jgi:hypothetical protein
VRGKAAYLFRAFTAPSVRDEAWLPLPRGLRAGYRVVRPVRLVLEHAGRLVRGRRGER